MMEYPCSNMMKCGTDSARLPVFSSISFLYLSVHSRVSTLSTLIPPADDAPQVGDSQLVLANQRTPTVPLT